MTKKPPHPDWVHTVRDIEAGNFPDLGFLEMGLRSKAPVPIIVRQFLAKAIQNGQLKRKGKGRPAPEDTLTRETVDSFLKEQYAAEVALINAIPKGERTDPGTPSEIALERVSILMKRHGWLRLSPEAISKRLKLARRAQRR